MNILPRTEASRPIQKSSPERLNKIIWSVAGGKGGTGKTILTANLGIGMAVLGYNVILIDADLGIPNLHNYLGISRPAKTLDDFITNKTNHLRDVIIETPHKNLKLISGGTDLVGIANLTYAKKQQLIRQINWLEADIIMVDLGAGISNNIMDYFNISACGIIVSNPEPNANQDAYFFLKNALYRRIKAFMGINENFRTAFRAYRGENGYASIEMPEFYNYIKGHSPALYNDFSEFINEFHPSLIMNKVWKHRQKKDSIWFINLVKTFLEIEVNNLGELRYDKRIIRSSEDICPFILRYPDTKITRNFFSILGNLNTADMKHHDIRTFRHFRSLLKKQQKLWL